MTVTDWSDRGGHSGTDAAAANQAPLKCGRILFTEYITRDEPNLWSKWYDSQDEAVQAKHDVAFEFLEAGNWQGPYYKRLNTYSNIGEVRIRGGVQWRIFGFRRSITAIPEFVTVHIGSHKGRVYSPKGVLKQSEKRLKEVQDDPNKADPCKRPGSD